MTLQSDLFYPPTWLVAGLHVPYTLWIATLLQILHIYLGGLGAWFLARSFGLKQAALVVGCAYLLMGGFFIQSQHVDIVRGFCWTPWLLLALDLDGFRRRPLANSILLTGVCALFIGGAYPGQLISAFIIGPSYVLAQLFLPRRRPMRDNVVPLVLICLSALLAAALGLPKYLPFLIDFSAESLRFTGEDALARGRAAPVLIFSTVLSTDIGSWPGDVSIRSYFVSAPILFLALMSRRETLTRLSPLLVVSAIAVVLALDLPTRVLGHPPRVLSFSRFPISDYKAYIALAICLCAGMALARVPTLRRKELIVNATTALILLVTFYFAGAVVTADPVQPLSRLSVLVLVGGLLTAAYAFASIVFYRPTRAGWSILVLLVFGLVTLDAAGVYWRSTTWAVSAQRLRDQQHYFMGYDTLFRLPHIDQAFETLRFRPARLHVEHVHWYSWRGFFSGDFVMAGEDSSLHLRRHAQLIKKDSKGFFPVPEPGLPKFMQLPSTAILLPPKNTPDDEAEKSIFDASLLEQKTPAFPPGISMRSYRNDGAVYNVDLSRPGLLVENEMYWRGWTARIIDARSRKVIATIPATETLKVLRSWQLPAGKYLLKTRFEEPDFKFILVVTAMGAALLVLVFIILFRSGIIEKHLAQNVRQKELSSPKLRNWPL